MDDKNITPETPCRDDAVAQRGQQGVPIDLSILAQISHGDRASEIRMLNAFRKSNAGDAEALEDAIKQQDIAAVARISHRLVGACRIAGAMVLAGICEAVEQAAHAGDWDAVQANSDECYRELERVNAYLCTIKEVSASIS